MRDKWRVLRTRGPGGRADFDSTASARPFDVLLLPPFSSTPKIFTTTTTFFQADLLPSSLFQPCGEAPGRNSSTLLYSPPSQLSLTLDPMPFWCSSMSSSSPSSFADRVDRCMTSIRSAGPFLLSASSDQSKDSPDIAPSSFPSPSRPHPSRAPSPVFVGRQVQRMDGCAAYVSLRLRYRDEGEVGTATGSSFSL